MRVITGTARGKRLIAPEGMEVRPTSDKVKEAIFSIIQFEVPGAKVLDLFCGSGQLGIEALSRGAETCVFVDMSVKSREVCKQNLQNTGLFSQARVVAMDAMQYLNGCNDQFDIVFLDPPYHRDILPPILSKVVEKTQKNAIIICEHDKDDALPEEVGEFSVCRRYLYGRIALTTYRKKEDAE